MKKILVLLVLIFLFVGANFIYWINQLEPVGSSSELIIYELHPGPFKKVAHELKERGVIKSAGAFTVYARLKKKTTDVRVGEYALAENMSAKQVLEIITSGKSITHDVTFQEGLNMFEYASILAEKKLADPKIFLDLCKNQSFIKELLGTELPSLEGYLFPDTYKFTKFSGEKEIIKTMVEKAKSVFTEINDEKLNDLTKRKDLIILASMIEKETGAGFERDIVSSVFHNRLDKKMKLQSDPTIIYGIKYDLNKDVTNIRRDDITAPTRFNTYTVPALPMGPISNPGKEAILAALKPAKTPYLYFVSYNDGTHHFSKTYEEHLRAVRKYQVDPSGRKGKSWRDLKTKEKSN